MIRVNVKKQRPRIRRSVSVALFGLGCALVVVDGSAIAQDALGRGDALDANLGVGTGGRNVTVPTQDFRARNLLITGDVAGGRGFRDAVGYRADADFRGDLGSDDIFRFRADAALSSPRFAGLGRVADQFRFGQDLAMLEFRRLRTTDPRQFRPEGLPDVDRRITGVPGDDRIMADRISERYFTVDPYEVDALRDVPTWSKPGRLIGVTMTEEGDRMFASASPLHGISFRDEQTEMLLHGVSDLDVARLRDDLARGRLDRQVGAPFRLSFAEQLRVDEEAFRPEREVMRVDERAIDVSDSPYVEILQRIARRYAGIDDVQVSIDPSLLEELDEEFTELREQLQAMRRMRGDEADRAAEPIDPLIPRLDEQPAIPFDEDDELDAPQQPRPERRDPLDRFLHDDEMHRPDREIESQIDQLDRFTDPAVMERTFDLLRHGHTVDRLAPDDGSRINELILSGQSSLRRGNYFTAESQFARALRLSPNHPLASIGVAHSQLGAGLTQAAAVTIRRTLASHPEIIDTRYDERLLPSGDRLHGIIDESERQLDDQQAGPHAAIVLAYLGHQLKDRSMVERGLDAIERFDPDDSLLPVLRGVWLPDLADESAE